MLCHKTLAHKMDNIKPHWSHCKVWRQLRIHCLFVVGLFWLLLISVREWVCKCGYVCVCLHVFASKHTLRVIFSTSLNVVLQHVSVKHTFASHNRSCFVFCFYIPAALSLPLGFRIEVPKYTEFCVHVLLASWIVLIIVIDKVMWAKLDKTLCRTKPMYRTNCMKQNLEQWNIIENFTK